MITTIPISKARVHLGELTNKVFNKENIVVLNKAGLNIAAIVSMDVIKELGLDMDTRRERNFDEALATIRERNKDIPLEEIERDIAKAVKTVREEIYQEKIQAKTK